MDTSCSLFNGLEPDFGKQWTVLCFLTFPAVLSTSHCRTVAALSGAENSHSDTDTFSRTSSLCHRSSLSRYVTSSINSSGCRGCYSQLSNGVSPWKLRRNSFTFLAALDKAPRHAIFPPVMRRITTIRETYAMALPLSRKIHHDFVCFSRNDGILLRLLSARLRA